MTPDCRLETAKLTFNQVTQQWTEVLWLIVSDHKHDINSCTWLQCIQSKKEVWPCTSAHGLMTHHFPEHEAWNCRLTAGCKLHPVLLTQIYYWALLFCKQRVQFYLRIWPWCLSAERVFHILFCINIDNFVLTDWIIFIDLIKFYQTEVNLVYNF